MLTRVDDLVASLFRSEQKYSARAMPSYSKSSLQNSYHPFAQAQTHVRDHHPQAQSSANRAASRAQNDSYHPNNYNAPGATGKISKSDSHGSGYDDRHPDLYDGTSDTDSSSSRRSYTDSSFSTAFFPSFDQPDTNGKGKGKSAENTDFAANVFADFFSNENDQPRVHFATSVPPSQARRANAPYVEDYHSDEDDGEDDYSEDEYSLTPKPVHVPYHQPQQRVPEISRTRQAPFPSTHAQAPLHAATTARTVRFAGMNGGGETAHTERAAPIMVPAISSNALGYDPYQRPRHDRANSWDDLNAAQLARRMDNFHVGNSTAHVRNQSYDARLAAGRPRAATVSTSAHAHPVQGRAPNAYPQSYAAYSTGGLPPATTSGFGANGYQHWYPSQLQSNRNAHPSQPALFAQPRYQQPHTQNAPAAKPKVYERWLPTSIRPPQVEKPVSDQPKKPMSSASGAAAKMELDRRLVTILSS